MLPVMFGGHPNIVGQTFAVKSGCVGGNSTGAFSDVSPYKSGAVSGPGSGQGVTASALDASSYNEIYAGSSVQVAAVQVLCCIKF